MYFSQFLSPNGKTKGTPPKSIGIYKPKNKGLIYLPDIFGQLLFQEFAPRNPRLDGIESECFDVLSTPTSTLEC